ncbi:PhoX family protein [Bordetella genomosp. 13]|uniref:PhoX family protein n=1 Tax=Bordetella genomosp. 13 TaxID=463040 RepID=UPI0011A6A5E3|nr:alkaline phosphatase PhoX [Bordetella genomosp. 13]
MTDQTQLSRRRALKFLSGAPLLPLGAAMGSSVLLAACGGSDDDDDDTSTGPGTDPGTPAPGAKFKSAKFVKMEAPSLAKPADMATTLVNSAMEVTYDDGTTVTYKLGYQTFFNTGDMVPDGNGGTILAGGYYDINNNPIIDRSGTTQRQFFSDSPDGTSLLKLDNPTVPGVSGNTVFAVVQFEYTTANLAGASTYGQLPAPYAVLTLDQNPDTGALTLVKYHNVDTSSVNGIWIPCGASLSPWNTHLSSEEYEPDASLATDAQLQAFGNNLYANSGARANPYLYGHMPEVTVHPDGTGSVVKHYGMGRISHELVQVMPDQRTVLMGDDATNGGLFMYVADKAADLSAGSLYVAKFTQGTGADAAKGAGAGTLKWVLLGHATSEEVRGMASSLRFADIMDRSATDPGDTTYTRINYSGKVEWIRVKPGMTKAAAFLETHRYASLAGGSMWLSKNEGTTVNAKDKILYSALANINSSMVAGNAANPAGSPAVSLLNAGGIMASKMGGGQVNTDGGAINSEWVPHTYSTLLYGKDIPADALGNTCDPELPASPDNLKFSEKLRTLFIGEDSGNHVNNFLWAYNVDTKELSRLLSTPAGAESTGLHAVDELNGWTYIMSNFQHPGDWGGIHNVVKGTLDPLINANYRDGYSASVGYVTGLTMREKK